MNSGPLNGVRVVEFAGLGPTPFCAMMLADMGADVVRVDRPTTRALPTRPVETQFLNRGRRSLTVDLKHVAGADVALKLISSADALVEGFRPGTMERLGLGPEACMERNPRLVYGRASGWGQTGPYAHAAGHDLNYIALTGALHAMGHADAPPPVPLNVVGDFGGGGMLLAFGIVSGLLEARAGGRGQVIDAAMIDGAALLTMTVHEMWAAGQWSEQRGTNILDGGAPFYRAYVCADNRYVSVGAVEPAFYAELVRRLGLDLQSLPAQHDRSSWTSVAKQFADIFASRTQAEWCTEMAGTDACFAPVLPLWEAADHPHMRERQGFVTVRGHRQPAPAPRFSRTPGRVARPPAQPGEHTDEVLSEWGFDGAEITALRDAAVVGTWSS